MIVKEVRTAAREAEIIKTRIEAKLKTLSVEAEADEDLVRLLGDSKSVIGTLVYLLDNMSIDGLNKAIHSTGSSITISGNTCL